MDSQPFDLTNISPEVLKEFEVLRSSINVNSGELMKTLMSSFRREVCLPETDSNTCMTIKQIPKASPISKVHCEKTPPGSKLNRVCEKLHGRHAKRQQEVLTADTRRDINDREEALDLRINLCYSKTDDSNQKKNTSKNTGYIEKKAVVRSLPKTSYAVLPSIPKENMMLSAGLASNFHGRIDSYKQSVNVKNFLRDTVDRRMGNEKNETRRLGSKSFKTKNEGMRLVNENILFPGVYTGTFKLPGCRRGGRKHTVRSGIPVNNKNVTGQTKVANRASENFYDPMRSDFDVARRRGRPPVKINTLNRSNYQQISSKNQTEVPSAHQDHNASLVPGISSEELLLKAQQASNELKSMSPLQYTQSNNSLINNSSVAINPQFGTLTFMLSRDSLPSNSPCFVTVPANQNVISSIGFVPMALPTQACVSEKVTADNISNSFPSSDSGANLTCYTKDNAILDTLNPNHVNAVTSENFHQTENSSLLSIKPDELNNIEELDNKFKQSPICPSKNTCNSGKNDVNLYKTNSQQFMKSDSVNSKSEFYCCSFKLKPQAPEVRKGGSPAKRSRGRPKSTVIDAYQSNLLHSALCDENEKNQMYQDLFHCKMCNEIVLTADKTRHQFCHKFKNYKQKLTCSTCGVLFQPVVALGSEEKDVDGCEKIYCQQCTEMFSRETSKAKLLESKLSPPSTITCDKCGQIFSQQASLLEHRKLIHNEAKDYFMCSKCDKILYSKATYLYHQLSHGGIRTFKCTYRNCNKVCRNEKELIRHSRVQHLSKKIYKCSYENCKKHFYKNFHLQEHVRVKHLKIKPYTCHWAGCCKQFAGVRHLKVHMLIHRDEKPLKCDYCDYRCRQRNALNWHMRKHPEVPYPYRSNYIWKTNKLKRNKQKTSNEDRDPVSIN